MAGKVQSFFVQKTNINPYSLDLKKASTLEDVEKLNLFSHLDAASRKSANQETFDKLSEMGVIGSATEDEIKAENEKNPPAAAPTPTPAPAAAPTPTPAPGKKA